MTKESVMKPKNTITFRIGDETRPILEDKNLKESIFFDLYHIYTITLNKSGKWVMNNAL
ncbi:MAG: hypothetical protein ACRC6R_05745 [Bacteroidales bacterium]